MEWLLTPDTPKKDVTCQWIGDELCSRVFCKCLMFEQSLTIINFGVDKNLSFSAQADDNSIHVQNSEGLFGADRRMVCVFWQLYVIVHAIVQTCGRLSK